VRNQTTIGREVIIQGIGLHRGEDVELCLCPAEADTGIRFTVKEGNEQDLVQATPFAVSCTNRGTVLLGSNGAEVRTVEHFMAACYGMKIDNLLVQVQGGEMPAGDGSSLPFVQALSEAGQVTLSCPRKEVALTSPVWVKDMQACLVAIPSSSLEITLAVEYPFVGCQLASFVPESDSFATTLAPARTFGFRHEAEQVLAAGLAQGASLNNVLLIDEFGYSSALRFPDEVVRHKILDLLGDLALIGSDLQCKVLAIKPGHRLNNQLARAILSQIETGGCDVHA
jgi:UDP-3-O-[3-hydroxymyristoyl] N-acetylglucosamine deacetylase